MSPFYLYTINRKKRKKEQTPISPTFWLPPLPPKDLQVGCYHFITQLPFRSRMRVFLPSSPGKSLSPTSF